ncbi:MAG: suppressor of fused domain protein [Clostridia bacterium]|nr:suppressor of fused domain protein [Clostridia bacterium]
MKTKEMEKLTSHFDLFFGQNDCTVLHPIAQEPHIDVLLYKPNDKYPYWKLVTMGASDFKMPAPKHALGDRNEYLMFVDPSEDLTDPETANWYYAKLLNVALYPMMTGSFISYGHSIDWEPEDGEEMICAFIEMPQVIEDPRVLHCKLGLTKTVTCLQVVLLNSAETDKLKKVGPERFSYYLFPDNQDAKPHFLCERNRSERF